MNSGDKTQTALRVGVSSCLLGNAVRYDGTDRYCPHIAEALGEQFSLIAFCPELAIGLGVPRPPIQLVLVGDAIRLCGVTEPQRDMTNAMLSYVQGILPQLETLSGYVFKARSPSCGVADVPVYRSDGSCTAEHASGLFAQAIQDLLPDLPLSNEEALLDAQARTDFISRVRDYRA